MARKTYLAACLLLLVTTGYGSAGAAQPVPLVTPKCDVTVPNGVVAEFKGAEPFDRSYGNKLLSLGPSGLWREGTVRFEPGGAGFVLPDGGLGMKFGWQRAVAGVLKITGRRLDARAAPLRANVPCCYDKIGFQSTALIFSSPGCWEVTGQIGDREDSRLTFVTRVVKIGVGPAGQPQIQPD